MSTKNFDTFYLFKGLGSFLNGIASITNLSGNNFDYHYSSTPEEADSKAIANDWGVVGNDIKDAINKMEEENDNQLTLNF